jgi:three-Cys-motif partner protein
MKSMGRREDVIGKWSEEKLELLEKYLKAYARIMNSQKRKWLKAFHYIDAFAGSGQARAKDEERYIEGSPLRALQCDPPFDCYWFIEMSPWRVEKLKSLQSQFPNRKVIIRQGDCNQILREEIIPQITWGSNQRALIFLDPYGLQVEWTTVVALAKARTFDIFVNFPLMAVTRILKRGQSPEPWAKDLLNKVMGNTDWLQQIYRPSEQLRLFGKQPITRSALKAKQLVKIYVDQIFNLFDFVSNPVIMTNSKNVPLYALFLASHNSTAVKIVNDIFNRYERLREVGR